MGADKIHSKIFQEVELNNRKKNNVRVNDKNELIEMYSTGYYYDEEDNTVKNINVSSEEMSSIGKSEEKTEPLAIYNNAPANTPANAPESPQTTASEGLAPAPKKAPQSQPKVNNDFDTRVETLRAHHPNLALDEVKGKSKEEIIKFINENAKDLNEEDMKTLGAYVYKEGGFNKKEGVSFLYKDCKGLKGQTFKDKQKSITAFANGFMDEGGITRKKKSKTAVEKETQVSNDTPAVTNKTNKPVKKAATASVGKTKSATPKRGKYLETKVQFKNDVEQEHIETLKEKFPVIKNLIENASDKNTLAKNINEIIKKKELDRHELKMLGSYVYNQHFAGKPNEAINFLKNEAKVIEDIDQKAEIVTTYKEVTYFDKDDNRVTKNDVTEKETKTIQPRFNFVEGFAAKGGIRVNTFKAELDWFKDRHSAFCKELKTKPYNELLNYIADKKDFIKGFSDRERRVMFNYLCKSRNFYDEDFKVDYTLNEEGIPKGTQHRGDGTQEEIALFNAYQKFNRKDELPHGFYNEVFYVRGSRPSADPTFEKLDKALGAYYEGVEKADSTPSEAAVTPAVSEAQEPEPQKAAVTPTAQEPEQAAPMALTAPLQEEITVTELEAPKEAVPVKVKSKEPFSVNIDDHKNPVGFYYDNYYMSFETENDINNAFNLANAQILQPDVKNTFWIKDDSKEEKLLRGLISLRNTDIGKQDEVVTKIIKYRDTIYKPGENPGDDPDPQTKVGINIAIYRHFEKEVKKLPVGSKLRNIAEKQLNKLGKKADKANNTWFKHFYNRPNNRGWNKESIEKDDDIKHNSVLYKAASEGKFEKVEFELIKLIKKQKE